MTVDERPNCLHRLETRDVQAGRKGRKQLPGGMAQVTGFHQQSLVCSLGRAFWRKPRTKKRGKSHGAKVGTAIDAAIAHRGRAM